MPHPEEDEIAVPVLREGPGGAAAFALTLAYRWLVWSTRYRSALVDVTGGLEAGQHGMVALQARSALEGGVDVYLATKGRFFVPDGHRWSVLAEVCGEESAVYQNGWRLECEDPDTPDAVSDYAQRCRRFVEERLEVRPPRSHSIPEDLARFEAVLVDIAALAAFLEIESPLSGTRFERAAEARWGSDGEHE